MNIFKSLPPFRRHRRIASLQHTSIGLVAIASILSSGACTSESTPPSDSAAAGAGGTTTNAVGGSGSASCSTNCDDEFQCTIDTCVAGVCKHSIGPNSAATACQSDQYCTVEKGCVSAPACASNADCTEAWKGDACKANARCDAASSVCIFDVLDKDGDTHVPYVCGGDDCNDGVSSIYPGADESCNGVDDNCDGTTDEQVANAPLLCDTNKACIGGVCTCKPEYFCGTKCVELSTDPKNCGACGVTCVAGQECNTGACTCPEGKICGELFKKLTTEPATLLTIHQGYLVMTRAGILVATPTSNASWEHGLVWTGYVNEAVGDGAYLFFSGGIQCTRAAIGCTGVTGRIDLAYTIGLSEPMSTPPTFLKGATSDLVIHGENGYWPEGGSIYTARKLDTPGTPTKISPLTCTAMTGDDAALYCAVESTDLSVGDGSLYRLGYDGTVLATLATGLMLPHYVQVAGGFVYWTDRSLERVAIDGTSRTTVATWSREYEVSRFIVDGAYVYYVGDDGFFVRPVAGGDAIPIGIGSSPLGYVVDSTHVYWSDSTGIYRAKKL